MSKLLYDRALSYLNIDIAVYGHDHVRMLATPLLYNAIYTATKMVSNLLCLLAMILFYNNHSFLRMSNTYCFVHSYEYCTQGKFCMVGEKLANLANCELSAKIFLANIHRYTKKVFGICTECSLFTKSFYLHDLPKFPMSNISHVW